MDSFDKHTLVLVLITLGRTVEEVVQVLVDLLRLAVFAEEAAEHALPADPEYLHGEARLRRTLALTIAGVAALALGLQVPKHAAARVHHLRLADHEAVLNELPAPK